MYDLPYHKAKDEQDIKDFIAKYPFAFLTGCDSENKPVATQIPVFIEEKDGRKILRGHLMKNTDHHKAFLQNENVLAVFTGHSTYVSGTWYKNPYTPSTWNFMSVHAKGVIKFLDDEAIVDALRMVSLHFEKYNRESTTIYDNLPSEFTARLMKAIVAFEIEIKELDTVFKLSQDRDEESYKNIIGRLREQGDESGQVIASEMEKRINLVFPELNQG
ncbi:MAG: FMN-binding negative transcriptional regulator [Bacteroidetes bacterium]|nr:FMN-binding negative transcriptional regulator [Bacteroidota bacterium]